jgi:hypothetical protein
MQLIALSHLYRSPQLVVDGCCKRLAGIATIDQNARDLRQASGAACDRFECARSISHLGGGHLNGMWQAEHVHGNMTLDARYLLAGIVAFVFGAIGVLHALCVDDDEAG